MNRTLCGVYDDPDRMEVLDAMDGWLGTSHTVHVVFTSWHEGTIEDCFDRLLPQIWEAGRVPLLTWEPFTDGDATPDIPTRIAAGAFDDYLDSWAEKFREWLAGPDGELGTADDRRCYLRFAHEMNGDWYPWSPAGGAGEPADYVDMWRYVHDRVDAGLSSGHCQWVWCVNHADVGNYTAEDCYPGDEYVDWLGVDGFNWGHSRKWSSWQSPEAVFGGMVDRLERLADKPLCVPEVACSSVTEAGHEPQRKARWVREALEFLDERVDMWCWFNEDKETDWAVFGGERATARSDDAVPYHRYPAYRDAMTRLDGMQPDGPRLVDDRIFRGE